MKIVFFFFLLLGLLPLGGLLYLSQRSNAGGVPEILSLALNVAQGDGLQSIFGFGAKSRAKAKPTPPESVSLLRGSSTKEDIPIRRVKLKRGSLSGLSVLGEIWSHGDFVGARFNAVDVTGRKLTVRIDDYALQEPLHLYRVSYFDKATNKWENVCWSENDRAARAVLLSGTWDATGKYAKNRDRITVACLSSPLGSCVKLGYFPWKTFNKVPLDKYHQACVRMLRADYLGDGRSYSGLPAPEDLAFSDNLGYRTSQPQARMHFEAGWGENGAVQLGKLRFKDMKPEHIQCLSDTACHFKTAAVPRGEPLIKSFSPIR